MPMPPAKKKTVKRKKTVSQEEADLALVLPNFTRYFLLIALVASVVLLLWVVSPFFKVLIYAALVGVILGPLNKRFTSWFKGRRTLAAMLSTFLVVLVVLLPLTLFGFLLAREAVDTYQLLEARLMEFDYRSIDFKRLDSLPYIGDWLALQVDKYELQAWVNQVNTNLLAAVQDLSKSVSLFLVNQGVNVVRGAADTIINLVIFMLTLFFFFRDGDRIRDYLRYISPLPSKHEIQIEKKLVDTTHGIVFGTFGTALLQGIVGGIGFLIVGMDQVIFYATIMAFSSLIPYIGASIVWAPVALFLLMQGQIWQGIFLIIWGMAVVATVDNFTRPLFIGGRAQMHPLATFFAVLGGLFVMGIHGLVFGPLILSLALTILHIYQMEYKAVLKD